MRDADIPPAEADYCPLRECLDFLFFAEFPHQYHIARMNDRFHASGQYDRRIDRKHTDTKPIEDHGRKEFRVPAQRTALRLRMLSELFRAEALPHKEEKENRKTKSYGGIR